MGVRRLLRLGPAVAALTVLVGIAACTPDREVACGQPVQTGALPEWARAGFTGDATMPHVLGEHASIVAVLFGHPLAASRPEGTNNKILWVPKTAALSGDLVIEARLAGSDVVVERRVTGGPGPSIVDLPRAGCWKLRLSWGEHTDTMDLVYA